MEWTKLAALACVGIAACATAGTSDDPASDAQNGAPVDAPSGQLADTGMPDAVAIIASACPADEFAIGFNADRTLQCAPIDATTRAGVNDNCSIYLGWRDTCDSCTTAPAKWGRADGEFCTNGIGTNNTCTTPVLGGVSVKMFGLNLDGDANEDDKFHVGFQCVTPADTAVAGPCPTGSYIAAVTADGVECVTGLGAVVNYTRDHCQVYLGWRDSCDGCTDAPAKWGHAGSTACTTGTGVGSTCTLPQLGGEMVNLFGLNTDGEVNGDDKFYMGFRCTGAEASAGPVAQSCPGGRLVVAINANGSVECASPAPAIEAVVQTSCFIYVGWSDNCDGCVTAPAKWGRVSHSTCDNGTGADNTCTTAQLGSVSVPLFGLNTDGDVNDDDKFYVGVRCL